MKTRKQFVANSSSSSFIVALRKGATRDELQETLFGDKKFHGAFEREYPIELVMDTLFRDYSGQQGLHFFDDEDALVEEMCSGYYPGQPEIPMREFGEMEREDRLKAWETYDAINMATAKARLRELIFSAVFPVGQFPSFGFFIFEYEDGTSFGSVLEHGPTFDNVPHIKINKH